MQRALKTKRGVPDIDLKVEVSRQLLGAMTQLDLAQTVLSRPQDVQLAADAADSFRKWRGSNPTKPHGPAQFWDALASELGCESVTGAMLIHADIDLFI